jgi:hypothetical protein
MLTGQTGEAYVRRKDAGVKVRIPSYTKTAHYRIPDVLTVNELIEIKNVRRQGLSNQLVDFLLYAEHTGRRFVLCVRDDAMLSERLRKAIREGRIVLRSLGPLFTAKGQATMERALMPMIWKALGRTFSATQPKDENV